MGGSGGGGTYYGDIPAADLQERLRESAEEMGRGYDSELQNMMDDILSFVNDRDTDLINAKRQEIVDILEDKLDSHIDIPFGGSVAKNTYVDGLSDVDALIVLKEFGTRDFSPAEIRTEITDLLKHRLRSAVVEEGTVAITISYADGTELQLVPAIKQDGRLRVPSWTGKSWSAINPRSFTDALTRHNSRCDGKLIPTIKLAKSVISNLPLAQHVSGYHVEAMAIDVFRRYTGEKTTSRMLPYFFEKASKSVLKPLRDSTKQSVNVDGYLGSARSSERKQLSHLFERIAKRMRNASAAGSDSRWREMLSQND